LKRGVNGVGFWELPRHGGGEEESNIALEKRALVRMINERHFQLEARQKSMSPNGGKNLGGFVQETASVAGKKGRKLNFGTLRMGEGPLAVGDRRGVSRGEAGGWLHNIGVEVYGLGDGGEMTET